jgi:ABC-2 type transport system permease protein
MKIINIIIKELKQNIRDKKGMAIMIAFPILLILILGTAFANVFGNISSITIRANVLYKSTAGQELTEAFGNFRRSVEHLGINFREIENEEEAFDEVRNAMGSYIRLTDDEIRIFKNDRYNLSANFVEAVMNSFVQRYNLIAEVVKVNPQALGEVLDRRDFSFVTRTSIDRKRTPRAIDYYAVTMITLITLYGAMGGAAAINGERTRRTGSRVLTAPVSKVEYLTGKVLGLVLLTMVQISMVVIVSKFLLKTYWGENMSVIMLILASEVIMAVSLGVGLAFAIKKESASNGILNTAVPFMIFLGGGYVPLEQFNSSTLLKIADMSPVRWVNKSIFNIIYNGDTSTVLTTLAVNIGIAVVFLIIASIFFKREVA